MNVLNYSLEALAFSYLSRGFFTAIHNLWTWVAVVTAAVSFWRIRATSSASVVRTSDLSRPCFVEPIPETAQPSPSPSADESEPSTSVSTPVTLKHRKTTSDYYNGVTRGRKFSIKFDDEGEKADQVAQKERCVDDDNDYGDGDAGGEWWESWERLLGTKRGEMGWYRYQDLTAINGNVVRLWDDRAGGRWRVAVR